MIAYLIKRPVAIISTAIAFIILGIISLQRIPISLLPEMSIPKIKVLIDYDQLTALELENTIVKDLRNELQQLRNLDGISSISRNGKSIIELDFAHGTDLQYSFIETNEKIDQNSSTWPKNLNRPRVIKSSDSDIASSSLAISLKDTSETNNGDLGEFVSSTIKRRLEQQNEIAFVDISGLINSQISIRFNPRTALSYGISQSDIETLLLNRNAELTEIKINDRAFEYNIRFAGLLRTIEDVRNIQIMTTGGRIMQLKDICIIKELPQKRNGSFMLNASSAINLKIYKDQSTQTQDLKNKLTTLEKELKFKYEDLDFTFYNDQSKLLEASLSGLRNSLILGFICAVLVMLLFLRRIKPILLITLSLPLSLLTSFFFFELIGISINIMSLSGLILGIGLMIDNAIIVIENIARHEDNGASLYDSCLIGAKEVAMPILSSVLTNCAVFIPLIFLSGIAGGLFKEQAYSIATGLFLSFCVSILFLPTLYLLLGSKKEIKNTTKESIMSKSYKTILNSVLNNKLRFLLVLLIISSCALYFTKSINRQLMPQIESHNFVVDVKWNENTSITENQSRIQELIKGISVSGTTFSCHIGQQQYLINSSLNQKSNHAEILVEADNLESLGALKDYFQNLRINGDITLKESKSVFTELYGSNAPRLQLFVYNNSKRGLPEIGSVNKLVELLPTKLDIEAPKLQDFKTLNIEFEKLELYSVNYNDLIACIQGHLGNRYVTSVFDSKKSIPVVLDLSRNSLHEIIQEESVSNINGLQIPLRSLISVNNEFGYESIMGNASGITVPLNVRNPSVTPQELESQVTQVLSSSNDLQYEIGGSYFTTESTIKELNVILLVSVMLLYFILAIQFESFVYPLIILIEVPFDFIGAVCILYFFGESINMLSLIGLVVMGGIIINDSILKIDAINQLLKKGIPLVEAVKEGGKKRLRAILMTSLTTILALIPVIFQSGMGADLQKPMAIIIIGGLIIGTLASLFLMPVLFIFFHKIFKLDR